ncbi:hypothetical protein MesoLjLa_65410 (plasmid) [Mesorhizobium sp. L-2-11]|nr:hypothetical protein MesoLjLa_65410 [Mesorhizobium sp. L-2-11]
MSSTRLCCESDPPAAVGGEMGWIASHNYVLLAVASIASSRSDTPVNVPLIKWQSAGIKDVELRGRIDPQIDFGC